VPCQLSEHFAAAHPNAAIEIVDSGHELTDVLELISPRVEDFLGSPR